MKILNSKDWGIKHDRRILLILIQRYQRQRLPNYHCCIKWLRLSKDVRGVIWFLWYMYSHKLLWRSEADRDEIPRSTTNLLRHNILSPWLWKKNKENTITATQHSDAPQAKMVGCTARPSTPSGAFLNMSSKRMRWLVQRWRYSSEVLSSNNLTPEGLNPAIGQWALVALRVLTSSFSADLPALFLFTPEQGEPPMRHETQQTKRTPGKERHSFELFGDFWILKLA